MILATKVKSRAIVLCPRLWHDMPVGVQHDRNSSVLTWPGRARAALSLTFDDARLSQVDRGLPLLDRYGVKATYYVSPGLVEKRLEGWRQAVAAGHEIGNHTFHHPCSGNFRFSRHKALEDYTLAQMAGDLAQADEVIHALLGVRPITFAYPCGQTYVGRGIAVRSYVPLVADRFLVGRGFLGEIHNDPEFCDLAQVFGMDSDGVDSSRLRSLLDSAVVAAGWLVFAGHEIGAEGRQCTREDALAELCRYAREQNVWIDTVAAVGRHIQQTRHEQRGSQANAII